MLTDLHAKAVERFSDVAGEAKEFSSIGETSGGGWACSGEGRGDDRGRRGRFSICTRPLPGTEYGQDTRSRSLPARVPARGFRASGCWR